jgi:hypothetical protein
MSYALNKFLRLKYLNYLKKHSLNNMLLILLCHVRYSLADLNLPACIEVRH